MTARRPQPRDPGAAPAPRAILRVPQVLAALAHAAQGLTLSQLSQALSLPKTTLHTMLRVLEQARFVTASDGRFRIGPEAVMLGAAIAGAPREFPDCALGILEDVSRRTGETALLAELTPDRRSCRYVASVETDNWLRFSVPVGSLRPAYATGSGQAMLAYLDDDALREALAGVRLERITPRTVASRTVLARALRRVRERGVSSVDGGTVGGVISVAAPIFDARGHCIGAITAGGPTARVEPRLERLEHEVIEGARQASRLLGYLGAWPPVRPAPGRGRAGAAT
jgi:DNA-binding IclR family transcriptional regulator